MAGDDRAVLQFQRHELAREPHQQPNKLNGHNVEHVTDEGNSRTRRSDYRDVRAIERERENGDNKHMMGGETNTVDGNDTVAEWVS